MSQPNSALLQSLNACVAACEHCASACLQEPDVKMMARCIALDRDCADICALTARLVARGSMLASQLLNACAEACRLCGAECAEHDIGHCQACAEACRRCANACQQAVTDSVAA